MLKLAWVSVRLAEDKLTPDKLSSSALIPAKVLEVAVSSSVATNCPVATGALLAGEAAAQVMENPDNKIQT